MSNENEEIIKRLLSLPRYNVGSGDDGDGHSYDYEDRSVDGRWVEWDDVQKVIDELKPLEEVAMSELIGMKTTDPQTAERYLQICGQLSDAGWHPVGQFGTMLFLRNGKRYDLSAADLTQLDHIEAEGRFLVSE